MPNNSKNITQASNEDAARQINSTTNPNKESNSITHGNSNITSNSATLSNDKEATQSHIADDLPVLAKDSYYLSRLERELARAVVSSKKENNEKASLIETELSSPPKGGKEAE